MIMTYPNDPLLIGIAGVGAGVLLGASGAVAMPRVIAAARAARGLVPRWIAARRAASSRRARTVQGAPGLPSAEVLAAIITAVRAELGKVAPATVAPDAAAPAMPVAPPVRSADPWIVR